MKIKYKEINFRKSSLDRIDEINAVIDEYCRAGYSLTLRQCYYQLVARNLIPNSEKSYKNTGALINDARLAGLIDWDAIVDRGREYHGGSWGFENPMSAVKIYLKSAVENYHLDKWENQENYVEVWVEKDALSDVVGKACNDLKVAYFACKGFNSQSAMWEAAQRFIRKRDRKIHLLYLGDHDPSGIDMTRDVADRLKLFGAQVEVNRLALNMEQIKEFQPPPNYAKIKDTRYKSYIAKFGEHCWELDSLEPQIIHKLITDAVVNLRDNYEYEKICAQEQKDKEKMQFILDNHKEIIQQIFYQSRP